jgi:type I restriction enzyme S subunit
MSSVESIEWVETLPSTWRVKRLGALASIKARLGWKGLKADEYVDEGYIFLSTPNLKGDEIDFENVNYITKERYEESPEIMLKEGDVLMVKDGATLGIVALVKSLPAPATVNGSTAVIRTNGECDSRYLCHWLRSRGVQQLIEKMKGGMGVPHLFQSDLRRFPVAFPTFTEQRRIADYLDETTAKIDRLMNMRRRQMALLKEQRAALIQEAVTRGLNPNVPMKDSGLPWLGQIPAHWFVLPLKRWVSTPITDGPHETPELLSAGIDFVSAEAVQNGRINFESRRGYIAESLHKQYCRKCKPQRDDIFLVKSGATTGKLAMVDTDREFSVWSPLALIRVDKKRILPKFMFEAMHAEYFTNQVRTTWSYGTQPNIAMRAIEQLQVVAAPLDEQKEIIRFVDMETANFAALHDSYERQLSLLSEYRAALIHECVTGRRRVGEDLTLVSHEQGR